MIFILSYWMQIQKTQWVLFPWVVIGILFIMYVTNRVTVLTSLTRERYKFGASMKDIEKKGECDLYRGLAMAQVCFLTYTLSYSLF